MIVNATPYRRQVNALSTGAVGEHESTGNEGMRFDLVIGDPILVLESDQVSLTAECATLAGNIDP